MFDVATAAVEGALAAGASYADARVMVMRTESMNAHNQVVEALRQNETAGVGVRALMGSSWGFFATPTLTEVDARAAGHRSAEIAQASASVPGPKLELADVPAIVDEWANKVAEDPIGVSLARKGDLLVGLTSTMQEGG